MASVEQDPVSLDAPSLSERFSQFYGMMMDVVRSLADKKGIEVPADFPTSESIAELSADNPEDCKVIMDTLNKVVDFVEKNGLRRHSTPQEMAEFVEQHANQGTPEGEFLKELARLKSGISVGIEVRTKLTEFAEFKQQSDQLLEPVYAKKHIIEMAAEEIKKAGFPVDGKKLIKNYLKAAEKDPNKAYDDLIKNPATFAPIETKSVKEGKINVNPSEGRKINQKLGKFLKNLKI